MAVPTMEMHVPQWSDDEVLPLLGLQEYGRRMSSDGLHIVESIGMLLFVIRMVLSDAMRRLSL